MLAWSVAGALLALSACNPPFQVRPSAPPVETSSTSIAPDPASGIEVSLRLGAGERSREVEFEAPEPRRHVLEVEVVLPIGTDLRVALLPVGDAPPITVLDPARIGQCEDGGGSLRCRFHFPALEAPRAGTWTAAMRKLSAAPAELGLAVRFRAVTYTIGENIYLRSDCPGADPLLRGGADGLPAGGQTDQQRVASLLEAGGSWLIERFGAVEVRAIPRNGQVWVGPGDGIYQVIEAIDSQIEVVLGPEAACPQAPYLWNGIPLLFTRGN